MSDYKKALREDIENVYKNLSDNNKIKFEDDMFELRENFHTFETYEIENLLELLSNNL